MTGIACILYCIIPIIATLLYLLGVDQFEMAQQILTSLFEATTDPSKTPVYFHRHYDPLPTADEIREIRWNIDTWPKGIPPFDTYDVRARAAGVSIDRIKELDREQALAAAVVPESVKADDAPKGGRPAQTGGPAAPC